MKISFLLVLSAIVLVSCQKINPDLLNSIRDKAKPPNCTFISYRGATPTNMQFWMDKKMGSDGRPTDLKVHLMWTFGSSYLYDLHITYQGNKAYLTGSQTKYAWYDYTGETGYLDTPVVEEVQPILYEVTFDPTTKYALSMIDQESNGIPITLTYDGNKLKSFVSINSWVVTTDENNNIIKIWSENDAGTLIKYSEKGNGKKLFYAPIGVAAVLPDSYSILEILDWGPFQPNRERTEVTTYWDGYYLEQTATIDKHIYAPTGNLLAYGSANSFNSIGWACESWFPK